MKTVVIIQARMGSTRLPGKVLKVLCGESVLGRVVERVRSARLVDEVVIATTDLAADDEIAEQAGVLGASVFRGSEADVLARYHGAATQSGAELIVRVTSDCPLFDGTVLTSMLQRFHQSVAHGRGIDYLSNTLERSFPRGLDSEIFLFKALDEAHREAKAPFEREHVTPFIYRHPERFVLENFLAVPNLARHRWTLDTIEDWQLISAIYTALQTGKEIFGTAEVIAFLEQHPELVALNANVEQKGLPAR